MMRKKIIRHKIPFERSDLIKRLEGNSTIDFIIRAKKYLVFRSENSYKAIINICPHQNKSMEGAVCEGDFIICPIHKYQFSKSTGQGHGLSLDLFEIEFEGEDVIMLESKITLF
jgi:3-phenylpropionate/trans-cinnamate dioxygenase ferredoxin subunit